MWWSSGWFSAAVEFILIEYWVDTTEYRHSSSLSSWEDMGCQGCLDCPTDIDSPISCTQTFASENHHRRCPLPERGFYFEIFNFETFYFYTPSDRTVILFSFKFPNLRFWGSDLENLQISDFWPSWDLLNGYFGGRGFGRGSLAWYHSWGYGWSWWVMVLVLVRLLVQLVTALAVGTSWCGWTNIKEAAGDLSLLVMLHQ